MKDADETIDRLMAGLRDAEPSPGMERRILEAMEAHHAMPSAWFLRPSVAASLVCAAALAASIDRGHKSQPAVAFACKRGQCWATHTAGGRSTQRSH